MQTDHLTAHYTLIVARILATAQTLHMRHVPCRGCRGGVVYNVTRAATHTCEDCDGTMRVAPEIAVKWWPFPLDPNIAEKVIKEFLTDPSSDRDAAQRAAANIAWILVRSPEGTTQAAEMLFQWERMVSGGFIYALCAEAVAIRSAADKK